MPRRLTPAEQAAKQQAEEFQAALAARAQAESEKRTAAIYAEAGKLLREAAQIRRQAQHCRLCGFEFRSTGEKVNANKRVCDNTVGDPICVAEQGMSYQHRRRTKKKLAAPADVTAHTNGHRATAQTL